MSILLLAKRGQLSLDDDVGKYVSEWSDHGSRITIRELLTHASGLRDAFMLQGLAPPREDGTDPNEAILKVLVRARGLNFAPGTEFQYNNGGYNLLGSIVKRVSGQSLRAFADENIFRPLKMTHTHFHDDPGMVVPDRVSGYHQDARGWHLATENAGVVGNAGVQTTVGDLLLWEQNFADVRVGDAVLVDAMQRPAIATGWSDKSSYGFGLEIADYRGLRTIGHGGGDRGIASYVVRYPEQDFAVAMLCNLDNIGENGNATRLTQRVADVYLDRAFLAPAGARIPAPTPVVLSPAQLAEKTGLYRDISNDSVGRIFLRDGKLRASGNAGEEPSVELTPVDGNRFVVSGTPITVEFIAAGPGGTQELHVTGDGPKPRVSLRVLPFAPSSTELRAFAGAYSSAEVEGVYTLVPRNNGLAVEIPGRRDLSLAPVFRDGFAGEILGAVKFSRDAHGVVTGFTATSDGARGLRFVRTSR